MTPEQVAAIASIEQGNYGIKLKLYDKVRALELLGKHFGLFEQPTGCAQTEENNLLEAIQKCEVNTDDIPEIK